MKILHRAYKSTLSPMIGMQCRFHPDCSTYVVEAIETHGIIKGGLLGIIRIARCSPLSKGGVDLVPRPRKK